MKKLNRAKNDVYRKCFSEIHGDCPHASTNEYGGGIPCCTIDRIIQIKFYGCTPQKEINKQSSNQAIKQSENNFEVKKDCTLALKYAIMVLTMTFNRR